MGLAFNANTQHIQTDKVYGEGRYLIGLGQKFIKYPSTYQTLQFGGIFGNKNGGDIIARTEDGLPITLQCSFQYSFSRQPADLVRLYLDFAKDYAKVYSFTALSVIRDVSAKYKAFDFITKRSEVADAMLSSLKKTFVRIYANVMDFQLVDMEFNAIFADAIENTQVANQDIQQAYHEQQIAAVEASTIVLVAQEVSKIQLKTAQSRADAILMSTNADAQALKFRVTKQIDAFLSLRKSLNLTSSEHLLNYIWLNTIEYNKMTNVNLGMQLPTAFMRK